MTAKDEAHQFETGEILRIGEIPNPLALAHFLATTPLLADREVFVLVENEIDRHVVARALQHFLKSVNKEKSIIEWTGDITALPLIHAGTDFIIADQITLENHPLPSKSSFERYLLKLAVKDQVSLADLKKTLTQNGYERQTSANRLGRWAIRGDVIDVHTGLDNPLRITLHQNEIESISSFDLGSGKTIEQLESISIPPLSLAGRSTIFDHLAANTIALSFNLEEQATDFSQILVGALAIPNATNSTNAGYSEPKAYHLRFKEAQADIATAKQALIITEDEKKTSGLLKGNELTFTNFPTQSRGFVHQASRTIVLTDQALGLGEQSKKKQASKVKQAMVQALKPGDHVVHLYHGIAKFQGTEIMHINELDREYFVLEYAGKDKIYLPIELAERIDKYLGDPNPTLHKLSDASWHEAVAKVKAHALEMARELLDVYARRSVSTASQMVEQPNEAELDKRCSFELTPDQNDALHDIYKDLAKEKPMDRLLCGDVGFGKTEVAIRAAYRAVLNGYQVAVLAPTTVLVQQHYDTFQQRLEELGVNIKPLSRLRTSTQQQEALDGAKNGTVDIVIGTHRLLSRDMTFKRLGLIVIDEEQRFGVKAKESLTKLRTSAHILSMTATPIPRTLHLSLAGVREISTILTAPHSRKPVKTVIQPLDEKLITRAIRTEMKRSGQTYFVYNRVQSIERRRRELQALIPKAKIGIAHGQLTPKALAKVMHEFDIGEIDVLLATTIVENGLDIPNANTLIVENASHFGLGELYQLKGRVGRSDRQGYAYFLYTEEVPEADVKRRFVALQESQELGAGFELAMRDMEIRGVGNILGKEQHGHTLKIGLHLYIRLLNQAVQELEGVEQEIQRDIPIDLPIEARIPEELLSDAGDRIVLYQQLANIRTVEELTAKRNNYSEEQRFQMHARLNPKLAGLFDLLEIKLLTANSTLLSIDTTYPTDQNRLHSPRITISSDRPLPKLPFEWELIDSNNSQTNKARVTLAELGSNWVQKIKHLIQNLQQKETDEKIK